MTAAATVSQLRTAIAPPKVESLPQVQVGLADLQSFELAQRVAKLFASSTLVPNDYQGNLPNCVIALNMAARIGADPMMVMQNLYIVHGRPGWSAQFMIATFNACGRFSAIRYEFKGQEGSDDWSCRAWATEKETGERIDGAWVSIGLAKKEGWYQKNGSKWQTMPQQMLQYRSASWFIRTHAPEIAMGIQTVDEVRDTWDLSEESPGVYAVSTDDIRPPKPTEEEKQPRGGEISEEGIKVEYDPTTAPRHRPTKEEMAARRQKTVDELTSMGVLDDVCKVAGEKGWGPPKAWTTAHCQRAVEIGREVAGASTDSAGPSEDVPPPVSTITCPESGEVVSRDECPGCEVAGTCKVFNA